MDSHNTEALTYGSEYMLGKFANLPDRKGDSKPAEEFRERFGELFPGLDPESYWVDVAGFRKAWHTRTEYEREIVGKYLANVFNRTIRPHVKLPQGGLDVMKAVLGRDVRFYPAVSVDFSSGKIALTPSVTLLDWLASSLLECRHRLGICEREGCLTPYFVKMHPRARYCSEGCFRNSRLEKKNQWWKRNHGKAKKHAGSKPVAKNKPEKSGKKGRR